MDESTQIRAVESSDLDDLRRMRADQKVWVPALGRPFPVTEMDVLAWFDSLDRAAFPTSMVWCVANSSGAPVGLVRLDEIHWIHRTAFFGIWIGSEHWGQGHASRAIESVCRLALEHFGLWQLRLKVVAGELAAQHVYERSGFRREAVLERAVVVQGERRDLIIMVIGEHPAESHVGDS